MYDILLEGNSDSDGWGILIRQKKSKSEVLKEKDQPRIPYPVKVYLEIKVK